MTTAPVITQPVCPTPVEEIAEAIDRLPALHGLSLEDRLWLARNSQEFVAEIGDVLFEEGTPADRMIIILKGEIHVRRLHGGPMELFIGRAGQITGLLPYSRMKVSGGQGFAISPVWGLLIPKSLFPEMLQAVPSMAQRSVSILLDRVREVTRIEQQAEKLTALGQLAGNLSHAVEQSSDHALRHGRYGRQHHRKDRAENNQRPDGRDGETLAAVGLHAREGQHSGHLPGAADE